jgi:hypothetical protein
MMGLQELTVTGRTRELPVFGCVRSPASLSPSQPADQPRWIWIMDVIDEVVRLDILQHDQQRKQQQRDQIVAMEEAESCARRLRVRDRADTRPVTNESAMMGGKGLVSWTAKLHLQRQRFRMPPCRCRSRRPSRPAHSAEVSPLSSILQSQMMRMQSRTTRLRPSSACRSVSW